MESGWLLAFLQSTAPAAGQVQGFVNYSVSLGDVATIVTSIVAAVSAYTRIAERLKAIEVKLDVLWVDYERRVAVMRKE